MNPQIGCQIIAPEGLGSLRKSCVYFFLCSTPAAVVLAWFSVGKEKRRRVYLMRLERESFENALLSGDLYVSAPACSMPPWLADLEGVDMDYVDGMRTKAKISLRTRAERRHSHIYGLVEQGVALLGATDFVKVIGDHARKCTPKQNPTRIAVWLIAYHITGENLWALTGDYHHIGEWDRTHASKADIKYGRRPQHGGKRKGYSAIPLQTKITDAYSKFVGLGKKMAEIYGEAMLQSFGCCVATDEQDRCYFFHPDGLPFPSDRQFRYWVIKKFSLEEVQVKRYGHARIRQKSKTSQGKFSEAYSNVLEAFEADAYHVKERPRRELSDDPAAPLIIARGVDPTSGRTIGVGACVVAENAECYRTMLFTACVDASVMSKLLNIHIAPDDWPGLGPPPDFIRDRGAGASQSVFEQLANKFPIRQLTPSYQGQSKPNVESTHPRHHRLDGAPTYIQSELTTFQMFRREVMNAIAENKTRDVSSRLTLQMIADGVIPNPKAMCEYLVHRGRINARRVDFATAVRAFLRPVEFKVKADGLYLEFLRYDSPEWRARRMTRRLAASQETTVRGYIFPMSVAYAWIELDGKLVEVEATLPLNDDIEQRHISITELNALADQRRQAMTKQRELVAATRAKAAADFHEQTGKHWSGGQRRAGPAPKTSAVAQHEARVTNRRKTS